MTRSDPLPSTGKRHPIFARVFARAGPARAQRLADVIWPTFVGGCHASRDTLTAITTAGFHLVSTRRFRFPDSRRRQPRRTCSGSPAAHPNPDRRGASGSATSRRVICEPELRPDSAR
jgi:hypothetical protein